MFLRFSVHVARLLSRRIVLLSRGLTHRVWEGVFFSHLLPSFPEREPGGCRERERERERERQPGPCRPQSCILACAAFSWAASGHLVSELRQGWLAFWTARGSEQERTASSGIILWYWCCGSSLEIFIRADCQASSGLGQCRQCAEPVRWGSLNLLI